MLLCITFLFTGCGSLRSGGPLSKTDFVLDTVATIAIYKSQGDPDKEELLNQAFDEIRRYERLFSAEIKDSDISRINEARGRETEVSPETIELIKLSLKYSELSGGAFDITIRPVSKLWDFKEGKEPPEDSEIKEALTHVGYKNISINEESSTVTLSDPLSEIEPGGIAKGYIGDRIKEYLKDRGVTSAIINLGGNVVLIGSKPDGSDFTVGIEKPFSDGEMLKSLKASDVSVVTSGNYQRYFYFEDRLYHHILDTSTGYPVAESPDAVTVVSEYSADGDALSTALFCLGEEKGRELINNADCGDLKVYFTDSGAVRQLR
ncbi:MAG: FAD:protein FMN transferase [Lachnospiraceae bacterium]|nr:FAD:protein FMN transferase [Lachnospiraceae bacterium]